MPWHDPTLFMKTVVGPRHGVAMHDIQEATAKKEADSFETAS
jgi:hypothetical protein